MIQKDNPATESLASTPRSLWKRIAVYCVLFGILLTVSLLVVTSIRNQLLGTPTPGVLYVDQHSNKSRATGSKLFPFTTITAATAAVDTTQHTTIIIADGSYTETVTVPEHTTLFGIDTPYITFEEKETPTMRLKNNTALVNIAVSSKKDTAVVVAPDSDVSFARVDISNADRYGLYMEESFAEERPEITTNTSHARKKLPRFVMSNSTVNNNDRQGLYLRDARAIILNSEITKNGEEGIDLHANMITTIKSTLIKDNGEGGIETELDNAILNITESFIADNGKSGVTLQAVDDATALVDIDNTTIAENKTFGIRCVRHGTPLKEPGTKFFEGIITLDKIAFEKNKKDSVSVDCLNY